MTVIVALISKKDGFVASDGRIFSPVYIQDGKTVGTAQISNDYFNKTFCLYNGKIVGCFAGIMKFSEKTISEHVSEIENSSLFSDIGSFKDELKGEMLNRLTAISCQEIIFCRRKLNVVLVGGKNLKRSDMRIISLEFYPDGKQIGCREKVVKSEDIPSNQLGFYTQGDAKAISKVKELISHNGTGITTANRLEEFIKTLVKEGIMAADYHPDGNGTDCSCGGKLFQRRTWYD